MTLPLLTLVIAQLVTTPSAILPDDGWNRGPTIKPTQTISPRSKSAPQPKRFSNGVHPCDVIQAHDVSLAIGYPVTSARISPSVDLKECLFSTGDPERYVLLVIGTYKDEKEAKEVFNERTDGIADSKQIDVKPVIGLGRNARSVGTTVFQKIRRSVVSLDYKIGSEQKDATRSIEVAKSLQPILSNLP